jgi:hypothetical protein
MTETMESPTPATTKDNTLQDEEKIWIKIMEQNLEGVMFHTFEEDLFCLLGLKGFKKLHKCQVQEESENLGHLKYKYMEHFKKLPILESDFNKWKEYSNLSAETLSNDKISEMVEKSMKDYCNWETEVLEHLLEWKRDSKDRQIMHLMIKDVINEIKEIETIVHILEEHEYHYDCICEMSDYLYRVYK